MFNSSGQNIEREEEQNIVAEGEDGEVEAEQEDTIRSVPKSAFVSDDLVNNYTQGRLNNDPEKDWPQEENDVSLLKTQTTPPQPLAAIVETNTIATPNVKNVSHHLSQRHSFNDFGEKILHGQQLNVHNLLDVAGSICAGPMGALCDMTAFSKFDCSPFGDLKDHTLNNQDFLTKKYYHPLYAHGVCRWPGCELPLDDMASFVK